MYRPQFAYPTPDGFVDEDFDHYYDNLSVPLLGGMKTQEVRNIPLQLDTDADFLWRGIKIPSADANTPPNIGIQLRAPDGRYIMAGYVPIWLFGLQLSQNPNYNGPGSILEPEIYCPRGSTILLNLFDFNNSNEEIGVITLTGVKRWSKEQCCGEACYA